jgi:hypothetical protein
MARHVAGAHDLFLVDQRDKSILKKNKENISGKKRSAALLLNVNTAAIPEVRGHQAVQRFLLVQL